MSIVGFDDLPAAGWPLVQLTTVAYDLDAMARGPPGLLVARIEEEARRARPSTTVSRRRLVRRATLGLAR